MLQIRFWLGLRPIPYWGSLQHSPDPLAGFKGPITKGKEGGEGEGRGKKGRKGRRGEVPSGSSDSPPPDVRVLA